MNYWQPVLLRFLMLMGWRLGLPCIETGALVNYFILMFSGILDTDLSDKIIAYLAPCGKYQAKCCYQCHQLCLVSCVLSFVQIFSIFLTLLKILCLNVSSTRPIRSHVKLALN